MQMGLLDLVRQRTEGRRRGKGESVPEWCHPFTIEEAAAEIGCSVREVREDLADAVKRGLVEEKKLKGDRRECRLTCADSWKEYGLSEDAWSKLPSVKRGPQLVRADEAPAEDEPAADEAPKKAASREVVEEFRVREGKPSRKVKFDVPPSSFAVTVEGGQAAITGVRQGPHLDLFVKLTSNGVNHLPSRNGSVVPFEHLPGVVPEAFLVEAAAVQLADKIAVFGPTLTTKEAEGIVRDLSKVHGPAAAVQAFYLEELEAAKDYFEGKGGKLKAGKCIALAREMPEKWRRREKAGPVKSKESEFDRLARIV